MRKLPWLMAATAVSAGLILSTAAANAATGGHAASTRHAHAAAPLSCPDGWCGLWGTITASPALNLRTGPGTSYHINGLAYYGDSVEVHCYTTGTVVNGDPYWDLVTDPNTGVEGYGADTFVYTGGNVNTQVRHC